MVRKSIETRDWVHSLEPRTVRPVMKRVLEELASAETLVGSLFEDGVRPPGSDHQHRFLFLYFTHLHFLKHI